jgi:S1-C subfamily serine protease
MKKFDQKQFESSIVKFLVIVLIPVVAGMGMFIHILWGDKADLSPIENGYVPPLNVYSVVQQAQRATVVVSCQGSQGSGFGFYFTPDDEAEFVGRADLDEDEFYQTRTSRLILTNFHVIQECLGSDEVSIVTFRGRQQIATIFTVDRENDLAALFVDNPIPALTSIWYKIRTGYWAMAVGSPYNMSGTTTFGSIIYTEGQRIYTSASLNRGNSGGPLVDNVGLVYGINTGFQAVAQNINWAIDINAVCDRIAKCYSRSGRLHPIMKSQLQGSEITQE